MVKSNSRQKAKNFSAFLQLIGRQAEGFPVELIPVAEESSGGPQALLVLDRSLSAKRKEELACAVVGGGPAKKGIGNNASSPSKAENFLDCVRTELARVKKTRLPCSLLLIRFAGKNSSYLQIAVRNLKTEIEGDHHLAPLDHATLALLLPGLNRPRALDQANAIHQMLAAENTIKVKIGLAVCMARTVPAAQEFLDMALNELHKAEQGTGDIFYSFHLQDDDSCQVTAEERAQLFSFLNSGKKE